MHIIVPMSGLGTRFKNNGYTVPKPLIMVEGKPMIQHVIELFPGENKFTFICNKSHLDDQSLNLANTLKLIKPECNIVSYDFSVDHLRGPVPAVLAAAEFIDDEEQVIVSYCDYSTKWNYGAFLSKTGSSGVDGAIACYRGFHPHMLGTDNYAFCKTNDRNELIEIREKLPFTSVRMNEFASNGTYYFKTGKIVKKYFKQLVDCNIRVGDEYYVSMVYNLMQTDGLTTTIFEIEKMLQWGTPKDLEEYMIWSNYFLHRKDNFNVTDQISNTTLVLPLAGAGSRFAVEGYLLPKPFLPVENKPMIVQAVSCLPLVTKKIFVCQKDHEKKFGLEVVFPGSTIIPINYITNGQACTCELALDHVSDDSKLMISACDNGVYYDIDKYIKLINDSTVDIIVWSFSNNPTSKLYPNMYAWLDVDENDFIHRVSVKKPFSDCENKYAIIGTMVFRNKQIFKEGLALIYKDHLQTNSEYYVDNMIEPLIKAGYTAKIFNVDNYLCWGTPNDYKTYNYWHEYFGSHP